MTFFDIFNDTDSIVKDFYKTLDKAIKDNNVKITVNGKPINFENTSTTEDSTCKTVDTPIKDYDTPCTKEEAIDPDIVETDETSLFETLTPDISRMTNGNEYYYLKKHVAGVVTTDETELVFENKHDGDYYTPGITDTQLLFVLLHRNEGNKDRAQKIIDVISTY